jgi:DNA repair protein RadD
MEREHRRPVQGAAVQGQEIASLCTADSAQAQENKLELRPYQTDVIDRLRAAALKHRRVLLVAPTGSGKTVIASAIVHGAVAKGKRVLFLAHRRELIDQAVFKLWSSGIDAGVILAGRTPRPEQPVQVASTLTLWHRGFRGTAMEAPPADVIVVDEAHHARARTYEEILEHYPDAKILGLTATPCRGDGRGLGNVFEVLVECPDVQALIDLGYLVTTKVYAPSTPDLSGIRVERGDYATGQLAARVNTDQLVGDIVEHWHRPPRGGRPSSSRPTWRTRCTSATSSGSPGLRPSTSTARRRRRSATRS